jgi:hypothetical protein
MVSLSYLMDHRFAWWAQLVQNGRDDSNSPLRPYSFGYP